MAAVPLDALQLSKTLRRTDRVGSQGVMGVLKRMRGRPECGGEYLVFVSPVAWLKISLLMLASSTVF